MAVQWDSISLAGAFLVGAVFSAIVVLRLARVIAQFLSELGRKKEPPDEPDADRRR